jgi:monofunctional biosynthetic peptidoglycan transglycosylase
MGLAVIAAEDQKFPEHWGFDVSAIEKALAHNERHENRIRGASTLSQQTAKNLFLWDGRSWLRKGLEAGLTVGMETVWSKKRILTVYLNIAEFGDGIFGVEAAAQRYFHKPASQLTRGSGAAGRGAAKPDPLSRRCAVGLCAQPSGVDLAPDASAGRGRVYARISCISGRRRGW